MIRNIFHPLDAQNPEDSIGERVLLLLLGVVGALRRSSSCSRRSSSSARSGGRCRRKGISAVYFAALGLGFMFFEITMIQRLVRFLGYPTYSLTVTLASILVFTGLGALVSKRFADRTLAHAGRCSCVARSCITLFYEFGARRASPTRCSTRASRVRVVVVAASSSRRSGSASACSCRSASAWSRKLERPRRRVRRLVVGGERLLLGDRLGAHDDPVDDVRLQRRCSSSRSCVYAIAALAFTRMAAVAKRPPDEPELVEATVMAAQPVPA